MRPPLPSHRYVVATAALLSPSFAFAQATDDPVHTTPPIYSLSPTGTLVPAGFTPRGTSFVYSPAPVLGNITLSTLVFQGMSLVGEDIAFAPGPWSTSTGRLTEVRVPIRRSSGTFSITNADVVVSFYTAADRTADPMITTAPFARLTAENVGNTLQQLTPNILYTFTLPAGNVQVPNTPEIFVTLAWHEALPGSGNAGQGPLLPGPTLTPPSTAVINHPFTFWGFVTSTDARDNPAVGATSTALCMDWNSNGVFSGGPLLTVNWPGYFVNSQLSSNEHRAFTPNVRIALSLLGTAPTPTCDDIDFNNNDVFPEDQDVIDFFNVLAGADCPTCNDIDFNNNQVFPEDQDIIDFFNVLAGGDC
jgi:hypothetical protein